MRRQVLERREARARSALVRVAGEVRDGLAQADVADRPRPGSRQVPRQEPLRRPLADAAKRRPAWPSPRHPGAPREHRGPTSDRARPTMYSALRREKPTATSSASSASATRSRVGNDHTRPARSPSSSTNLPRMANAACSETCCAVIDVTSASNGSGARGGRNPRTAAATRASTGSSRRRRRTTRGRTRRRAACARSRRWLRRRARRRRLPPPRRSGPRGLRRRARAPRPPTGSPDRVPSVR